MNLLCGVTQVWVVCLWTALMDENCRHLAVCYWAAGMLPSVHCLVQHMVGEWLQSFPDHRAAAFIPCFWNYRVRETHSDVIDPFSNRKKSPTDILQIPSVQIVYVVGFIHCYILKAWRCSFCHCLNALAFVVFFVLRIIWCCYLVITTRHPCCRSQLQSLAHIPGLLQQNSQ